MKSPVFIFAIVANIVVPSGFLFAQSLAGQEREHTAEIDKAAADKKAKAIAEKKDQSVEKKIYRRAIEEIMVFGRRDPSERFSVERSNTTLDLDAINERQPSSVFDLVREVPGVTIDGGPRANGSSISIRGMSNNEDVLVLIDGAAKNFEKYRFGQGLQIEPELLKTVSVSRGPATVTQGSGALGGVISMETKDAADLLKPGHRYGAMLKAGFSDNNDELLRVASVYAQPVDGVDILLSDSKRDSKNITLSTGELLPLSAAEPESQFGKIELAPDDMLFGVTFSHIEQAGREFFDTTTSDLSVGGEVYRQSEDDTFTTYFAWQPDNDWIDLHINYGDTSTTVDEQRLSAPVGLPAVFDYDIKRLAINNVSEWRVLNSDWLLDIGAQQLTQLRNTSGNVVTQTQQPSGETDNTGFYAQLRWQWQGLELEYGQRFDRNQAEVDYTPTLAILQQYGQQNDVERRDTLETLRASYQLPFAPLEIFAHKTDAIRPPKIDEYFSQGVFSRCFAVDAPPMYPLLPDPYRQSGICTDLYQPEQADSHEFGAVLDTPVFDNDDQLLMKWTHYHNDVTHVLDSLRTNPFATTNQPGREKYQGNEFEFAYARGQWELDITYAETDGKESGYFVNDSLTEIIVEQRSLYTIPGDLYATTLRWFSEDQQWEAGWRVAYRQGWTGFELIANRQVLVEQNSSTEHQLFARYSPWEETELRLTIDNLTDEEYRLPGGFEGSLGNYNQGKNIRFSWTQYFNF